MKDPRIHFAGEELPDLGDSTVAVLGCGSVGGAIAWSLAGAGVGHLLLADRDTLTLDNVRRHVCGCRDLGRAKANAVAGFVRERYARTQVAAHHFCLLADPNRLRRLIARASLVVVAVDCEAPKYLIDAIAWDLQRPVVYAGVYGGGWAVELILVDSAWATACYGCAARSLGRIGIDPEPRDAAPAYALPRPGRTMDAWPQADLGAILPAALLSTRLATARLMAERGHAACLDELGPPGVSAWRLALRRVPAWRMQPWRLKQVAVTLLGGCLQCGPDARRHSPEDLNALLHGDPHAATSLAHSPAL